MRRIYDPTDEGVCRVLVDRLWPRGVSKEKAHLDVWLRDVAPSPDLRRWYGHDPARFDEFARRYRDELSRSPGAEALERLRELATERRVILLTATRDVDRSAARVVRDVLAGH